MIEIPIIAAIVLVAFGIGVAIGRFLLFRKNLGEALVADLITRNFKRAHVLLNNLTFESGNETTQIDHVLVADTGIFVIETKHYKGWIFGDLKSRYWTQVIYRYKSKFRNPVHQNYGHLQFLQTLFNLPKEDFFSVVVFSCNAEFKSNLGTEVVRLHQLVPYLSSDRPVRFDGRKMAYIVGRIEMKRMRRSIETDEYHINSVRQRITTKRRDG